MFAPLHHLRHWFTPHTTNNFRARLLHNTGIFFVIGIILGTNVLIRLLDDPRLHILGFSSSITIDEVVSATNRERAGAGLKQLNYSERLADAARRKAANMFEENYWAHNSPSGKSPWVWFSAAGYNYVFAGENLAKDFGSTDRLISAWMASPTHKDNIVNAKYSEIGLAVVPGTIQGQETVLVVQLFGTPQGGAVPAVASAATSGLKPAAPQIAAVAQPPLQAAPSASPSPSQTPGLTINSAPTITTPEPTSPARLNSFSLARTLNLATTALFILALVLDLLIAQSKSLTRRVGNNWAHLIFINFILLATTIVNAGKIL